ncbi:MAG: pYEATS domain-containing protein [Candidatus Hodarchaeales archaeon]
MRLSNVYRQLRDNWYSWTISIQGTDKEIGKIDQVTYILHKSFPNNRLVSKDPTNQFAMTFQGWGEFLVKAEILMKDKTKNFGELWLNLGFPKTANKKRDFPGIIN